MRKFNVYLSVAVISLLALFTSCEDDEDALGPVLTITSSEAVTVAANTVITISWRADAGDKNLATFTIKEGNVAVLDEDNINWNNLEIPNASNESYVDSARLNVGSEDTEFTLIVTDKNDLTATKTVTVTIQEPAGDPIETYSVKLGSYAAVEGSSFASIDGSVYSMVNAKANAASIDFLYFWGATNRATISAPDDPTAATVFTGASGLATWTVRNSTKFGATNLSAAEFDALADDTDIITEADGILSVNVPLLAAGDVVAFKTASTSSHPSKAGLFKVVSVNGETNDGTIDIVVKVQE